jgi:hypothetical protein
LRPSTLWKAGRCREKPYWDLMGFKTFLYHMYSAYMYIYIYMCMFTYTYSFIYSSEMLWVVMCIYSICICVYCMHTCTCMHISYDIGHLTQSWRKKPICSWWNPTWNPVKFQYWFNLIFFWWNNNHLGGISIPIMLLFQSLRWSNHHFSLVKSPVFLVKITIVSWSKNHQVSWLM